MDSNQVTENVPEAPRQESSNDAEDPGISTSEDLEVNAKFQAAEQKLDELYELHDFFFSKDPNEKRDMLAAAADEIFVLLEELGPSSNPIEKARSAYIRGKAADAFAEYSQEAEEHLQQAVKLNPDHLDSWNTLGHCLWKKKDFLGAKNCYMRALEQSTNKRSLQELSMVLRQIPGNSEVVLRNLVESLNRAKAAVELDLNDAKSWYVLGNAHMTRFFKASFSEADMDKALQAYQRSERLGGDTNPDLFFNKANVLMYKEAYQAAADAVRVALDLDPSLPAQDVLDDIDHFMRRINEMYQRKGKIKAKRIVQLADQIKNAPAAEGYGSAVGLGDLREGRNEGATLHLKPLLPVGAADAPPAHFLCVDRTGAAVVLSVYHVDRFLGAGMTDADTLTVLAPRLLTVTYARPGAGQGQQSAGEGEGEVRYPCVQVFDPSLLLQNDRPIARMYAPPVMATDCFDA
mmetsp:Transcript_15515/g.27410  ORF Transcript_15515/g.27410 Transcript_15515/m.27410 type:complete len:461 (-) Transcript_15515:50-1432(-)|eukprot:CAMPEP_0194666396 /NCGR_PEP_ID=MMETSP0295-20121207/2693_1 /TAXON_ID=39354 /ORGANISM="Heterosigma akashiwo, Strain CCMP2393" /LENGTH=460 /DNA_ID=CAMNT_0039548643 /DNA_START=114 /DNA_END=1496 /DNA_ORIENTATION=+